MIYGAQSASFFPREIRLGDGSLAKQCSWNAKKKSGLARVEVPPTYFALLFANVFSLWLRIGEGEISTSFAQHEPL